MLNYAFLEMSDKDKGTISTNCLSFFMNYVVSDLFRTTKVNRGDGLLQVNETEYTSLMYEVLADQTMWAVLGRTAGKLGLIIICR